jgi:hypothetical protein
MVNQRRFGKEAFIGWRAYDAEDALDWISEKTDNLRTSMHQDI